MNIQTGEIKPMSELTDAEKASGLWVPIKRPYVPKIPTSLQDHARLAAAEAKRSRRRQRNASR